MANIRVIIADDHPITRAGIRKFLDKAIGIEVIGEAEDGIQALQLAAELSPDVLLLDMEMPGKRGDEVVKELTASKSPVKVLALSTYDDKQYIFNSLASGAAGYLTKDEVPERIVDAVRGVYLGEKGWVSRSVAAIMAGWTRGDSINEKGLTERELEVLGEVASGKTNQEIGFQLGISQKTVEKHLEAIYTKLNVGSRVEAVVLAMQEGLIHRE